MTTVAESNQDLNASIELQRVLAYVQASKAEPVVGRTQKVKEYTLRVKGVFGRNRKSKFQSFKLAVDQLGALADEEVQVLVDAALRNQNVKDAQCSVYVQDIDLEASSYTDSAGKEVVMLSRCFPIFSGHQLSEFTVKGSKVVPA